MFLSSRFFNIASKINRLYPYLSSSSSGMKHPFLAAFIYVPLLSAAFELLCGCFLSCVLLCLGQLVVKMIDTSSTLGGRPPDLQEARNHQRSSRCDGFPALGWNSRRRHAAGRYAERERARQQATRHPALKTMSSLETPDGGSWKQIPSCFVLSLSP